MTLRDQLLQYVGKLPIDPDDKAFEKCLKILAEETVDRIAITNPAAFLDLVCSQAVPEDDKAEGDAKPVEDAVEKKDGWGG